MGDRCYMELTCKESDQRQLAELGFVVQPPLYEETPGLISMTDDQANYAHDGHMPTDIIYYGHHSEGGDYPAGSFACDGKTFRENWTTNEGSFAVTVDLNGQIDENDLTAVQEYIVFEKKVIAMLDEYSATFAASVEASTLIAK